jgi:hypothetical protein
VTRKLSVSLVSRAASTALEQCTANQSLFHLRYPCSFQKFQFSSISGRIVVHHNVQFDLGNQRHPMHNIRCLIRTGSGCAGFPIASSSSSQRVALSPSLSSPGIMESAMQRRWQCATVDWTQSACMLAEPLTRYCPSSDSSTGAASSRRRLHARFEPGPRAQLDSDANGSPFQRRPSHGRVAAQSERASTEVPAGVLRLHLSLKPAHMPHQLKA